MIRRPRHPGEIIKRDYIKPLSLDVVKLAIVLDIPLLLYGNYLMVKLK